MKIFLEKVKYEITRAAEYLESKVNKHPDSFRVLIESLQDSVSLFHIVAATQESHDYDFFKILADAKSMLENLESRLAQVEGEEKFVTSTSLLSSCVKPTLQLVEIPKFCGDALNFRSFMDLFLDRVESLTDTEKFIFLKNHLEGEAHDVIDKIPITKNNFRLSVNLLEEMYGNETKCISALIDRMVTLPAVETGEMAEIRRTYWNLEASLRSLKQYNVNGNWFLEILYIQKFAYISSLVTKEELSFQCGEFRKKVRHFIEETERKMCELVSKKSSTADSGIVEEQEQCETKTQSTDENASSAPSSEILECIFCCSEYHRSENCDLYTTVSQRRRQVSHLCPKCLRVKHKGKPWEDFDRCQYCYDNSHNGILCPRMCDILGSRKANQAAQGKEKRSETLFATCSGDAGPTWDEPLIEDHDYFLPSTPLTTVTFVKCPRSGEKTSVRLVIAGASRSKICESVVDRLGMKLSRTRRTSEEVTVNLLVDLLNEPPVLLELLVVGRFSDERVISPTVAEFRKAHPHLADMNFPDTGRGRPIEMVIGGDSALASFAFNRALDSDGDECPAVNPGWSLVSTLFGWIIVGPGKSEESVNFSSR